MLAWTQNQWNPFFEVTLAQNKQCSTLLSKPYFALGCCHIDAYFHADSCNILLALVLSTGNWDLRLWQLCIQVHIHPNLSVSMATNSVPKNVACEPPRSHCCLRFWWTTCACHQLTFASTLSDDSCPDLGKYCSLQCPMGYERDVFGCEVCECSVPVPRCRPLTCTKTCLYGFVWVRAHTHTQ